MIQETKDFIERFKGTYSKTFQVQSRVKMLEKLELIEVDEEDTSRLRLKFPPSPRSGSYPVTADGVGKTYDRLIYKDANFMIERGDKIAFVGRNGEGKSTMVKSIMAEGDGAIVGYLAHDALDHRTLALTVAPHEGNLVATLDHEVGILVDEAVVALAHTIGNHGVVAATGRGWELEAQT